MFEFEGFPQVIVVTDKPICDFCSSPDVVFAYITSDFVLPQWSWGSDGPFAACSVCMKLVESGQRVALEKRALDTMIAKHGRILPVELMRVFIHDLHVEFWKRLGKGPKYTDA